MTEKRIVRLREKICESRTRLLSSHPFFALLLMYLKFVAIPDMKKISTNGVSICFSPDYLDKLYWYELDYILCHQVMHIICGDTARPFDLGGDDYHYACDIRLDLLLKQQGFKDLRGPHLGMTESFARGFGKDAAMLSPEEIAALLPYSLSILDERTRSRYFPDSDIMWNRSETVLRGVLILDAAEPGAMLRDKGSSGKNGAASENADAGGDSEGLRQLWLDRVNTAAMSLADGNNNGAGGSLRDFADRMADKLRRPRVDWRRILNNFIQEVTCDYSFSPPDRRYEDTGFFLPDFNEKDLVVGDVLFMVDTSGSVDDDSLAAAYSEIKGAVEQFGTKFGAKLGFFDTAVTPPVPFAGVDDLLRIIPRGGGGTDFRSVFEYVSGNCSDCLPACIVIFTDGQGTYPSESETLNIPVLWLLDDPVITPPFGSVTRISVEK